MNHRRGWVATSLLAATYGLTLLAPKAHYRGTPDLVSSMAVPRYADGWLGSDVSKKLNLQEDRFRFISRAFAREYTDPEGHSLLLLILDAGNFHHPKVCFSNSGFTVRDLPSTTIEAAGRTLRVDPLYADRRGEGFVVLYWMVINNQRVDWSRQKWLQLWYSLLNRQRAGYMVRVDVRTASEEEIPASMDRARHFILQTFSQIPEPIASHLTGT